MARENKKDNLQNLPACAVDFINKVIKKMRYRRKVRRDVQAELIAHFEDALKDCDTDKKREEKAGNIIAEFGDIKLLAVLVRRAKKRCRPLWQKVLLRTGQVLGIIFIYLLICTSPLMIGKPTIKIDYVEWLNESEQAGRDMADNARPYYEKAVVLLVKMPEWLSEGSYPWPSDFNDIELKKLADWLEINKETLEMLRLAADRRNFWNHYEINGNETEYLAQALMPNIMEPLSGYRRAAFVMHQNIRYEAYNGNVNQAMQDCFVLLKLGYDMEGKGFLVEQLVGIALEGIGLGESFRILEKVDVPPEVLKDIQEKIENLIKEDKPVISLDSEKVFWYDLIQKSFTDDGEGDGRPVNWRGFAYFVESDWTVLKLLVFDYPSRRETLTKVEQYFARSEELLAASPWELHNKGVDANSWADDIGEVSVMLDINGPAYYRVFQIGWRSKTHRRALLTVLALLRYEKEKGKYPVSLNELVEQGYLESLPMDPFSGKPLVYKNIGDDFLLYSVGEDFKDDDGEVYKDEQGRTRMWANTGDWVLWPLLN